MWRFKLIINYPIHNLSEGKLVISSITLVLQPDKWQHIISLATTGESRQKVPIFALHNLWTTSWTSSIRLKIQLFFVSPLQMLLTFPFCSSCFPLDTDGHLILTLPKMLFKHGKLIESESDFFLQFLEWPGSKSELQKDSYGTIPYESSCEKSDWKFDMCFCVHEVRHYIPNKVIER